VNQEHIYKLIMMKTNIETKKNVVTEIKKFLNNRRVVFFSKYPDAQKQQLIIDAENTISYVSSFSDDRFIQSIKNFNERFIAPLVPSNNSKYYQKAISIYNKIKQL